MRGRHRLITHPALSEYEVHWVGNGSRLLWFLDHAWALPEAEVVWAVGVCLIPVLFGALDQAGSGDVRCRAPRRGAAEPGAVAFLSMERAWYTQPSHWVPEACAGARVWYRTVPGLGEFGSPTGCICRSMRSCLPQWWASRRARCTFAGRLRSRCDLVCVRPNCLARTPRRS